MDEDNGTTKHIKRPVWADVIEWQTDVLIEVRNKIIKNNIRIIGTSENNSKAVFEATVLSSKVKVPTTGQTVDFTNKLLHRALEEGNNNDAATAQ